jgi:flagellar biosynthetic protein FlhB
MARNDNKTEQPTARRKREARREGNLPRSQETTSMLTTAAALTALSATAPHAFRVTGDVMREWLGGADPRLGIQRDPLISSTVRLAVAWSPAVLAAMVTGIAVGIAQGGVSVLSKQGRPGFKHLSWKRGIAQLSPRRSAYELLKNVLKFSVVGTALVAPVTTLWRKLPSASGTGAAMAMSVESLRGVIGRVIAGAVVIAVVDQFVVRRRWKRDLMMTRQEVIDEHKRNEGDPHAKAARKRRGMELRRRWSLGGVATADVVVTNPTHYAVALAYADGAVAPQVVAKGTERMARKIRREASRHGVPIIENRPLARALHRQVPVGGYVPEKFFDDVVKVLVAAYWRRGRVPDHVTASRQPGLTGAIA